MSEVIEIQKDDEHSIKPYKFVPELGDCADAIGVKYVSKTNYANNFGFRVAGRFKVKHAP